MEFSSIKYLSSVPISVIDGESLYDVTVKYFSSFSRVKSVRTLFPFNSTSPFWLSTTKYVPPNCAPMIDCKTYRLLIFFTLNWAAKSLE